MFQLYQDAMTIVRKYGKSDLFITFTCNPLWDDITSNLLPNQKVTDRPDLVVRVFKARVRTRGVRTPRSEQAKRASIIYPPRNKVLAKFKEILGRSLMALAV